MQNRLNLAPFILDPLFSFFFLTPLFSFLVSLQLQDIESETSEQKQDTALDIDEKALVDEKMQVLVSHYVSCVDKLIEY